MDVRVCIPVKSAVANCATVKELIVVVDPENVPELAAGIPLKGTWTPVFIPGGAGA